MALWATSRLRLPDDDECWINKSNQTYDIRQSGGLIILILFGVFILSRNRTWDWWSRLWHRCMAKTSRDLQRLEKSDKTSHEILFYKLALLWLQWSKSVKMLIYFPRCISKGRTLSNLTSSKYNYRSKWVDRLWLVKALSGIVEGGQNDSKNQSEMPLCAHLGQQSKQAVDWFWPL